LTLLHKLLILTTVIFIDLEGGEAIMLQNIGSTELMLIAVVLLIMFGGKKLPELARGIGDSIREFKSAAKDNA